MENQQNQNLPGKLSEETPSKFSWIRIFKIVLVAVVAAGAAFGVYFISALRPTKIFFANVVYGKHEHYLGCYDLPFYPVAQKTYMAHLTDVAKLKNLGAREVDAVENKCFGYEGGIQFIKGDILVTAANRSQKNNIEKFLGKDFFGIPYRIEY